jgi:hypothetical protein
MAGVQGGGSFKDYSESSGFSYLFDQSVDEVNFAKVAIVLGSIPASSDTEESEGRRQMK